MGELAALAAAVVWAIASVLFAQLGRTVSGLTMNALKCIVALVLFVPTLMWIEGTAWPTGMSDTTVGLLVLSGLIGLTIGDTAYFGSLIRLGPRKALMLTSLTPPITATLGWVFVGEQLGAYSILGMALTIGGVVWVIRERTPSADATQRVTSDRIGIALGVLGVICQAGGSALTKVAAPEASALGVSIVRLTAGVAGLVVVLTVMRRIQNIVVPMRQPRSAALLIAATFLGTYMGIWLMNAGLLGAKIGIAATLNSTSPIFVLPIAAVVLGERITPRAVLGAVVAIVGVALLML